MVFRYLRRFESHRNDVYLAYYRNHHGVIKIYRDPGTCCSEESTLNILNQCNVRAPRVDWKHENVLIEEFIEGETIGNLIHRGSTSWTEPLAEWFASLHRIKEDGRSFLKGDCNLKNFIFDGTYVHGIDFEKKIYGDPSDDLGRLFFFIMDSQSTITHMEKTRLIETFLLTYETSFKEHVDRRVLRNAFHDEMKNARLRRAHYQRE